MPIRGKKVAMKLKQPLVDDTIAPSDANRFRYQGSDLPPFTGLSGRPSRHSMRLGERLIAAGWVTADQIEAALEVKRRTGSFLGETMLEMGFITAAQLGSVLEEIYGVPYVDLAATVIESEAVALVPEKLARQKLFLPLRLEQDRLVTAMVDPLDL